MPIISEFFGIRVQMYWEDHMPPHFMQNIAVIR